MLQERDPRVENLLNLFNGIARRTFVHNDQYKATGSSGGDAHHIGTD